ncbi:MAG TPA: NmrA family NAD(P)-binding protein, partial [Lentzea sp.]
MKIAVTGATGTQGGAVARLLAERGHDVRRITRNPKHPNDFYGDLNDPASLRKAFADVDGLFLMTPLSDPDEVAQGKAAVDAAEHVPHVVFTSATNADRGTGIPPRTSVMPSAVPWGRPRSLRSPLAPAMVHEGLRRLVVVLLRSLLHDRRRRRNQILERRHSREEIRQVRNAL